MRSNFTIVGLLLLMILGFTTLAHAAEAVPPLLCNNGSPDPTSSMFDASSRGACSYQGLQHIFSTIICQFVTMLNVIFGHLFCSTLYALHHVVILVGVIFIIVVGAQLLIGTAQLNPKDLMTRILKLSFVFWIATDPQQNNPLGSGNQLSAIIANVFEFFMSFISDTSRWIVQVLTGDILRQTGIAGPPTTSACDVRNSANWSWPAARNNSGIIATFYFLDNCTYQILEGNLTAVNQKVTAFFIAMAVAMPPLFMVALYFCFSTFQMLLRTLVSFLVAITAIAFLLTMAPIFVTLILFQTTYSFFDTWVRFMVSFSLQVMVSLAILTMWLYSLTLFAPFFNDLANVIFPYENVWRTAAPIYDPAITWGVCDPDVYLASGLPRVRCASAVLIPPAKVAELPNFIFYLFYHMFTLLVVSYGFASLQKNAQKIAKDLAGPQYVPILNQANTGMTMNEFKNSGGQANKFMSKHLFSSFNRRHAAGSDPDDQMERGGGKGFMKQLGSLLGSR